MQQQADSFVVQSLEYAEQVGLVPMGKHRRGVLRHPHQTAIEPRRVPFDEPLSERTQYAAKTLRLDRRPDKIIAAVRRAHQMLDTIH